MAYTKKEINNISKAQEIIFSLNVFATSNEIEGRKALLNTYWQGHRHEPFTEVHKATAGSKNGF